MACLTDASLTLQTIKTNTKQKLAAKQEVDFRKLKLPSNLKIDKIDELGKTMVLERDYQGLGGV